MPEILSNETPALPTDPLNPTRLGVLALCFLFASVGFSLALTGRNLSLDIYSLSCGALGAMVSLGVARFGFRMQRRELIGLGVVALATMFFQGGFAAHFAAAHSLSMFGISMASLAALITVAVVALPLLRLRQHTGVTEHAPLQAWALTLCMFSIALRLVFLTQIDLIPEEAYYCNYAQHPAMGYLDHPPMVAWLISIGTAIFGDNEMGVRLPALICWALAALFVFRLTTEAFGKPAAWWSLILISSLLGMVGVGSLMTPDAPLLASWAGILYFGHRALALEKKWAWIGVGACIGLGMLSKYTTSLAVLGLAVFVLPQRRFWKQLLLPQLWVGALLSVAIFLPVLKWNWEHEWASFAFQSIRRMEETPRFALHSLLASAIALVGPVLLLGVGVILFSRRFANLNGVGKASLWFFRALILAPLAVFVVSSLSHSSKLNWTNPIWLGAIPLMSFAMLNLPQLGQRFATTMRWGWRFMIPVGLAILTVGFHYLAVGLPFVPNGTRMKLPVAWHEFSRAVEDVEEVLEDRYHLDPIVVGMDTYFLASEIAFYAHMGLDEEPEETSSRNMFSENGLMFGAWTDEAGKNGQPVLMIAMKEDQLRSERVTQCFDHVSKPQSRDIFKDGKLSGRFFYAVGSNYQKHGEDPFGPLLVNPRNE